MQLSDWDGRPQAPRPQSPGANRCEEEVLRLFWGILILLLTVHVLPSHPVSDDIILLIKDYLWKLNRFYATFLPMCDFF